MANKKQLTGEEIIEQLDGLDLDSLLAVSIYAKMKVDEKQKFLSESLEKINEAQSKLNGNGK
jgi:hypothetical protein